MDSNTARLGQGPEEHIPHDPMIISRVRTYLYENEDKVYIDVTEMADFLQRTYRDYQSRKRRPFRAMVRKAYEEITANITRQTDPRWQDDDDDNDEIDIEIDTVPVKYKHPYKYQAPQRPNGNSDDKELIDISSDDDQEKTTTTAMSNKPEEDMETVQISKRPHLSPSIEIMDQISCQQVEEPQVDTHSTFCNKGEKSRKRYRNKDKDIESTSDNIRKRKPREVPVVKSKIKFSDTGGITKVLEVIANLLIHMKHPEVYSKLGISPPRGFLLHSPPGCGKTLLAHAIAGELNMPLLKVSALELVAGASGESELRIRELFEQAVAIAPCILFLDEIDAVSLHKATAHKEMDNIVSQLLSCLDELAQNTNGNKVLVIGATSKPDSIDPALRRAGRFDKEITLGIPDKEARAAILGVHTTGVTLSSDVDLHKIASLTPGFVGADLVALIKEAAMAAVKRTFQNLEKNPSSDVEIYIIVSEVPKSPNENEITEADKEKQPVPNKEIENTDIIIDDDPPVQANSTENPEEEKADALSEVVSTAPTVTEEQKTAEDPPDITQPSKSPATEPMAPSSPTVAAEDPHSEPAVETETTDVPISSPKKTEQPVAATAPEEITIDSEPMKMQVEEEKKSDSKEKLADLLTWLQNDSPLTSEQLAKLCIEVCDFEVALKNVQPTAKREGFATIPNVSWEDIGALQEVRQELQMTILAPMRYAERFDSFGLNAPTGVLLCGPPGCGKTLLAKAIANEAGISFISIKGSDLLNMYVGESEKAVRQCFLRARNSAPCIIFFDELDAFCPRRAEGDNTVTSRVVNQMLAEMDGVEGRKDFFLMAASNRPEIIDPLVLRPGRLDKILYVGLPNALDRVDILRSLTKNGTKPQLAKDISLQEIAEKSEGYTGADLAALVREACIENLRESMVGLITSAEICQRHFNAAFNKIRPSVQEKDVRHYDKLHKLFSVKGNQHVDIPMSLDPPIDTLIEAMET